MHINGFWMAACDHNSNGCEMTSLDHGVNTCDGIRFQSDGHNCGI